MVISVSHHMILGEVNGDDFVYARIELAEVRVIC